MSSLKSRGRARQSLAVPQLAALLLLLAACHGSDGGAEDDGSSKGSEPGTTETAGTDASASDPTTTAGTDSTPDDTSGEAGPNFGLLTFTFYPADAGGSPEQLGMAGAWRTTPFTTDDFFAAHRLALFFPLAPAAADTLEVHDPQQYEWGKANTWLTLGNGLRLGHPDGDALACLQVLGDVYPLYLSDNAGFLDPACAPDPGHWQPGASYDLTAYGGPDFDDAMASGAVMTPIGLTLLAPDAGAFDFPLEQAKDLTLQWEADGGADDRVVIRVWDQFDKQLAIHAADDGSYTLPGAELGKLSVGPATITIAREHISTIKLAAGSLRVVARHEIWLYPDLF
ncbi:MAG: hypothetical protein H0T76_16760 [Nannocystis sp.]|nr:hypothetical protein [Nannocystis sp.]MBA3548135.1 hypothetical protein [Nannocystis sp.]